MNDFERYRESRERQGGRTDEIGSNLLWLIITVLGVLNLLAWSWALPGYRTMAGSAVELSKRVWFPRTWSGGETRRKFQQPGTILDEREPEELAFAFLDVGQGDAVFVRTPTEKNLLIDTGEGQNPDSRFTRSINAAERLLLPFLRRNGVRKLDYLITTHPHSDHIGGASRIIDAINIDRIWSSGHNHPTRSRKQMLEAIRVKKRETGLTYNVPERAGGTLEAGRALELGNAVKGWLLRTAPHASNANESSLALLLYYGKIGILLMGDTERKGERELIRKWGDQLDVEVLKVGHHGSGTSSSQAFVRTVDPDHSVIMVGRSNTFGHPAAEVTKRLRRNGSKIHRTDKHGSIFMFTDGRDIRVKSVPSVSAVN